MDTLVLNSDGSPLSYIPLSVVSWQVALRLLFTDKVTVLKEYDDWNVRSQHISMKVPSIIMMIDHIKWSKQVKYNRSNVYARDNYRCQLRITRRCKSVDGYVKHNDLTLDHVVPRSYGGKSIWTNVCASCKECNSEKGNDRSILPKTEPKKPNYYEILARRKSQPLYIRDEAWKMYIDWPDENVVVSNSGKFVDKIDSKFSMMK